MAKKRGRPAGTTDDNQATLLKREIKESTKLMKVLREAVAAQLRVVLQQLEERELKPESRVEIMEKLTGMVGALSKSVSESSKVLTKEVPGEEPVDLERVLLGR